MEIVHQGKLTITAQEEVVTLRRELEASCQKSKLRSAENARLASIISKTTAENERLTSTVH